MAQPGCPLTVAYEQFHVIGWVGLAINGL